MFTDPFPWWWHAISSCCNCCWGMWLDSSWLLRLDGRQYGKMRNKLLFHLLYYRHSVVLTLKTLDFPTCPNYLKMVLLPCLKLMRNLCSNFKLPISFWPISVFSYLVDWTKQNSTLDCTVLSIQGLVSSNLLK